MVQFNAFTTNSSVIVFSFLIIALYVGLKDDMGLPMISLVCISSVVMFIILQSISVQQDLKMKNDESIDNTGDIRDEFNVKMIIYIYIYIYIYRRSNHMTCRLHRLWPRLDPISNRFALVSITFKAAGSTKLVVAPILELHVSPLASWRGP